MSSTAGCPLIPPSSPPTARGEAPRAAQLKTRTASSASTPPARRRTLRPPRAGGDGPAHPWTGPPGRPQRPLETGDGPQEIRQAPERRLPPLPLTVIDGRVSDDERVGRQVPQHGRFGADDRPVTEGQVARGPRLPGPT